MRDACFSPFKHLCSLQTMFSCLFLIKPAVGYPGKFFRLVHHTEKSSLSPVGTFWGRRQTTRSFLVCLVWQVGRIFRHSLCQNAGSNPWLLVLVCTGISTMNAWFDFDDPSRFDWRSARWKNCNTPGVVTQKGVISLSNCLLTILLVRGSSLRPCKFQACMAQLSKIATHPIVVGSRNRRGYFRSDWCDL